MTLSGACAITIRQHKNMANVRKILLFGVRKYLQTQSVTVTPLTVTVG